MKLHCFGQSGHSYKVATYLNLSGLEWEAGYLDFFNGEGRTPEYHAKNPMGEAPYFEDGNVKLSQSGAILEYLVQKTGHFAPEDHIENLRWMLWDNHKGSSQFGFARFYTNFLPAQHRKDDIRDFVLGRVKLAIKTLENHLTKNDFVTGAKLSTADFACSSYLFYPENFGWSRQETPAIDAWLSRIENLPNWKHPYDLMPTDQVILNATPAAKAWHN